MEWLLPGAFAVLALPAGAALALGWVPARLRRRPGPLKVLGAGTIGVGAAMAVDSVPRAVHVSRAATDACSYAALALVSVAVLMAVMYDIRRGPSGRDAA
ncbi:hypothetical protein GCM10010289_44400 [Streptomyces violascens]|uniref:Uncharacterized protein n=1 Tax=Streptomyces violascens TaxID=67381 RepID=A0ABQ3QXQ7_9ACTN|nr:hypothetical protein GCM10010289_44400 [Streptomyces violascens]GHI42032.1 hypothetical protein Sviol_64400 [Streptomyces violascens]